MSTKKDEFLARSQAFKARSEALDKATAHERYLKAFVNAGAITLTAFVLSLYLFGSWVGTKGLVAGLVSVFLARWIVNFITYITWIRPTLTKIDAEFPAPPPREQT